MKFMVHSRSLPCTRMTICTCLSYSLLFMVLLISRFQPPYRQDRQPGRYSPDQQRRDPIRCPPCWPESPKTCLDTEEEPHRQQSYPLPSQPKLCQDHSQARTSYVLIVGILSEPFPIFFYIPPSQAGAPEEEERPQAQATLCCLRDLPQQPLRSLNFFLWLIERSCLRRCTPVIRDMITCCVYKLCMPCCFMFACRCHKIFMHFPRQLIPFSERGLP
jgi:hypothetical protein